ncbi:MAG: thermonuclease family protein [Pseudolabrys sp.]
MFLPLNTFILPQRSGALILAAAAFAVGLSTGAWLALQGIGRSVETPLPPVHAASPPVILRAGHPAEVLRVLDGDTFEARVRIWPGQDVTTRVRLRGIDAPEMKARCEDERVRAVAARDALARILGEGGVTISQVGQDKYGGRVDADAATASTASVSMAMLEAGLARSYGGGRRLSWCDASR